MKFCLFLCDSLLFGYFFLGWNSGRILYVEREEEIKYIGVEWIWDRIHIWK